MTPVLKAPSGRVDASPMARASRLLLLTLLVLLVLPAGAQAARGARLAMAEQDPAFFSDPRFRELGIRDARLVVSWDVVNSYWEIEEVDKWLAKAREAGVRP